MVQAGKMPLTETILDENGKFPLMTSPFQQLYLMFVTVMSTYDWLLVPH
jgi:hypothetical protein